MYEMLRKIYFWSNRVFCLSLCIICILCPGTRFTYNCIAFFINDQLRTKWLKNIVKGFNMNVLKNTDDDRGIIKLRFQCPIYIYTYSYVFILPLYLSETKTKNGCGFRCRWWRRCQRMLTPATTYWPSLSRPSNVWFC